MNAEFNYRGPKSGSNDRLNSKRNPEKGAFQTFLAHHPHLHKPHRLDEVHFFDKDEEYEKGLDHYLKIMPSTFKNEVTYEKTPKYLVHPDAASKFT